MNISAILHTTENRGDHIAEVTVALDVLHSDTIEDAINKAARTRYGTDLPSQGRAPLRHTDKLVLQVVLEP